MSAIISQKTEVSESDITKFEFKIEADFKNAYQFLIQPTPGLLKYILAHGIVYLVTVLAILADAVTIAIVTGCFTSLDEFCHEERLRPVGEIFGYIFIASKWLVIVLNFFVVLAIVIGRRSVLSMLRIAMFRISQGEDVAFAEWFRQTPKNLPNALMLHGAILGIIICCGISIIGFPFIFVAMFFLEPIGFFLVDMADVNIVDVFKVQVIAVVTNWVPALVLLGVRLASLLLAVFSFGITSIVSTPFIHALEIVFYGNTFDLHSGLTTDGGFTQV